MLKSLIFLLLTLPLWVQAGDYQVKIHVKNLPENMQPLLLRLYNGNMFVLDSTAVIAGEIISYRVPDNTATGMLRSILGVPPYGQQPVTFDFLFNHEDIELSVDFNNPDATVEVIRSIENRIYFDFQKADALFFRKLGLLEQVVLSYPDKDEFYYKAEEYYKKFQLQRDKLIDKTYATNRNTLAGRIIRNQKMPLSDSNLTPEQRDSLFRTDFLPRIDFTDTTLLYTNVYTDKLFRYVQMYMKRDASPRENEANCIRALDQIVPRLDANPIVQQNLLQFLITGFESMKMEEVLAHISSNYLQQCGGSGEVVKRRLAGYHKMAVGQKVADFTATDATGQPVNLYNTVNPYTLIVFWHTECSHCKLLMQELPLLCQKDVFKKHNVKIIGISIDENKENWEQFSVDYDLNWTNTHIDKGFDNPIAADYNLFATPSMFLLDENYNIVAKPTTIMELEKNVKEL